MKRFLKYNNKVVGLALAALTLAACTDKWDDHYNDSALAGTHSGTIWDAMKQNPELSNFLMVVDSCGYDKELKGTQAFTVFAPTNANFSLAQAQSVIDLYKNEVKSGVRLSENRAIKEFLQNHIARYTYSVSNTTNDSVIMMNGKYLVLTKNDFGGKKLESSNQLYENGVLFTIAEPTEFYNNIFEYLYKDKSQQPDGLDSMYNFWYDSRYYRYELDESSSVAGDVVNGKTTYLDSVMVKYNELFYRLADINDEDSTYWMLTPTNALAKKLIDEYSPYFMYHEQIEKYDSLRWFMPRVQIAMSGLFSMTRNRALKKHLDTGSQVDSLLSVASLDYRERLYGWGHDSLHYYQYGTAEQPRDPFAAGGLFDGAEPIKCSNGVLLKTDNWNIYKTETFLRTIVVEAESASRIVNNKTSKWPSIVSVKADSKYYNKISDNRYLEIYPENASSSSPDITFLIPNVLSGVKYDIYLVTVPKDVIDSTQTDYKPCCNYISVFYKDLDGTGLERDSLNELQFKNYYDGGQYERDKYFLGNINEDYQFERHVTESGSMEKVSTKGGQDVDTICIAKGMVFPTCSWGTKSQVQLLLRNWVEIGEDDLYDRTMRIDCIIFRPQEFGDLKKDE